MGNAHPTVRVVNLSRYQHYKANSPRWVKLYSSLLTDYDFTRLPDESKWHFLGLILLASKMGNEMPADPIWIGFQIGARSAVNLNLLKSFGLITYHDALKFPEISCGNLATEGEREGEKEKRNTLVEFSRDVESVLPVEDQT